MSIRAVCFDLGGVLVEICQSWGEAMALAGVTGSRNAEETLHFSAVLNDYQAGKVEDEAYIEELKTHLGLLSKDEAIAVHDSILKEAFPGTVELVLDLEQAGVQTGCLSNTNSLHWHAMTKTARFPAIARLEAKTASHLAGSSKPEPSIYRAFESESGRAPHEILNFDDVGAYVSAAQREGWHAVQIDPKGEPAAQMRSALVTFGLL